MIGFEHSLYLSTRETICRACFVQALRAFYTEQERTQTCGKTDDFERISVQRRGAR